MAEYKKQLCLGRLINCVLKWFVIFSLLNLTSSCALLTKYGRVTGRARNHHQKGEFDQAVFDAVEALHFKPDYEKAQTILIQAFPEAIESLEAQVGQLKSQSAQFRGDVTAHERKQIVTIYETLIRLNTAVEEVLPLLQNSSLDVDFKDYHAELQNARTRFEKARNEAADMHYQKGTILMQQGGLENNRRAVDEFKQTLQFVPNYKDAETLYKIVKQRATKVVVLIPFKNQSNISGDRHIGEFLTSQFIGTLKNAVRSFSFLDIKIGTQRSDALTMSRILGAHEMITGQVTEVYYDTSLEKDRYEEKKTISESYYDHEGIKRTREREISAIITIYTRKAEAQISGFYQVVEVESERILTENSFAESCTLRHEWARFDGDRRALSSRSKKLIDEEAGVQPPKENFLMCVAEEIGETLAYEIKSMNEAYR